MIELHNYLIRIADRFKEWTLRKRFGDSSINFEYESYDFTVRWANTDWPEWVVFPPKNKAPIKISVLSPKEICHGIIIGIYHEDETKHSYFQSLRVDNLKKDDPTHIPNLMGTTIGEIVAQTPSFSWNSSAFLSNGGKKMYERLRQQTNDPNSRFFGRIKVEYNETIKRYEIEGL